jgi:uncharacterized protein (DUF433 family)
MHMNERELISRITFNPEIYGGKAIIRGRRMAVEHILQMLGAGSTVEELLEHYDWLEREDILACFTYAARLAGRERVSPALEIAK